MRVLVGTDKSEAADRAVMQAAAFAAGEGGALRIVHVVNFDTMPLEQFKTYALSEHASLADVVNTFAEEALVAARRLAEKHGAKNVSTTSPFGDVAEVMLDTAHEYRADMIVVGRRGRGRLSGLLLGSVSQKLASVAPCPVVVVP